MADEFDELFVEEHELNEKLLKETLKGRVRLTKRGQVILESDADPTSSILLYLLANKVFVHKGIRETEGAGPKEIHNETGVAEGTVKVYVRELQKQRLLVNEKGKYYIPNHALRAVEKLVKEGKSDGRKRDSEDSQ